MSAKKKATDDQLISSYNKTKSTGKTADDFDMCRKTVRQRLSKLGYIKPKNFFNKEDEEILRKHYLRYKMTEQLNILAQKMGRTKAFICRQAKALGFTDRKHPKFNRSIWEYMIESEARIIFERFRASSSTCNDFCKRSGIDSMNFSRTMRKFFPDEWDHVIEAKAPRQTMYARGRAFEYRCRDQLKRAGYFVMRSPRSGSPVDLVAIKTGKVLFIQCKRGGRCPTKGWNEILQLAQSVSAIPIVAYCPTGRGVELHRILKEKDGSKRREPMENYEI